MKYAFIRNNRRRFRLTRMCSALGVSRSGYYEWLGRPESHRVAADRRLLEQLRVLHRQSREAYGALKSWHVLQGRGVACGKHRIARLRRQNGIEALRKRRFRVTVEHHKRAPAAPNTLDRQFAVVQPDRVWAGDMTVVPTGTGWLHLAVILDLYSRRVVGWAMGNQRGQALAIHALQMAIEQRSPAPGLLHHSDQGSAYTGADYHALLGKIGAETSMSRKGNCYDNAVVESFFSNLKNELTHHRHFFSREEARAAIFDYIELFYNRHRAHATLQYQSPVEYERSSGVAS
ncbi:MAG: IS3 family transposase [Micropepsaceae bacterium]